ncbi:hypothetical protein J568_2026 [Acinetobacter baumannii 6112]|nr:hypothetical protein J568_2026 [Acinetobacter baumannii 6112]
MDAKQYIRLYGVDRARELAFDPLHPKMTHVSDDGRHWINEQFTYVPEIRAQINGMIRLSDLKRLVESLDLIKRMGGISEVKRKFRDNGSCHGERMKSLIADHDSIFPDMRFAYTILTGAQVGSVLQLTPQIDDMGDDSNLDHHVSPFCEVRDV